MKKIIKDKLQVKIYDSRSEMGKAAGADAAEKIRKLLNDKEEVNIIFAAAPSQNEMLDALAEKQNIDWTRVNAFHMDEYIGLPEDSPQSFGFFLREHIFCKLPFKNVFYIDAAAKNIDEECERYTKILEKYPTDIVLLGIGENGHIAFNDPHVADFNDSKVVKAVELDKVCRQQQVNDGCFKSFDDVPEYAITLTIPTLFSASYMICTVPACTKAWAVNKTVTGEISEDCPASIMRNHKNAVMYCDADSGSKIL
ncbi:MAG: glucosamine-6-phosphate deaminase [Monoglobaceae bacterium]